MPGVSLNQTAMSKKLSCPSSASVSAMLGHEVLVRNVRGQYIVTNRPIRKQRMPSPGQVSRRDKFKSAAQYASRQIAREESAELYASGITAKKRTAYLVALTDFLNAPEVKEIDARNYQGHEGDIIRISATDDFRVTSVELTIINPRGEIIENGEAVQDKRHVNTWNYKTTMANPERTGTIIRSKAFDRPGNSGEREIVLTEEKIPIVASSQPSLNFLSSFINGLGNWLTRA
jgi:hypothetical protein